MSKFAVTLGLATLGPLAAVAPAQAVTLGDTTLPSGSSLGTACSASSTAETMQSSTDSNYNYTVPAGGGNISSWSVNTTGAKAGTPYGLLIAQPSGSSYKVVATDSETIPASAPTITTFTPAKPIAVQAGDILGVIISGTKNTVDCRFRSGPLTASDNISAAQGSTAVGTTLNPEQITPDELVNVSANLLQGQDVGITQQVLAAQTTAGSDSSIVLSVTNTGPSQTPVTITDTVPSGLAIKSVDAGSNPCTVSGQNVSCTVTQAPANVAIVVSPAAAGTYTNTAKAEGTLTDTNQANNTATASLTVTSNTTPSATAFRGGAFGEQPSVFTAEMLTPFGGRNAASGGID